MLAHTARVPPTPSPGCPTLLTTPQDKRQQRLLRASLAVSSVQSMFTDTGTFAADVAAEAEAEADDAMPGGEEGEVDEWEEAGAGTALLDSDIQGGRELERGEDELRGRRRG